MGPTSRAGQCRKTVTTRQPVRSGGAGGPHNDGSKGDHVTKIDKATEKAITKYRRALVGLAHADSRVKREGCDCCFCKPADGSKRRVGP